jgi:hypothetical protein
MCGCHLKKKKVMLENFGFGCMEPLFFVSQCLCVSLYVWLCHPEKKNVRLENFGFGCMEPLVFVLQCLCVYHCMCGCVILNKKM